MRRRQPQILPLNLRRFSLGDRREAPLWRGLFSCLREFGNDGSEVGSHDTSQDRIEPDRAHRALTPQTGVLEADLDAIFFTRKPR